MSGGEREDAPRAATERAGGHATVVLDSFTLRFSVREKEEAYCLQRFLDAYQLVVGTCLLWCATNVLRAIAFPERQLGCIAQGVASLLILALRVFLKYALPQKIGQLLWQWGLCTIFVLACATISVWQRERMPHHSVRRVGGLTQFVFMNLVISFTLRGLWSVPLGPRAAMLILGYSCMALANWHTGISALSYENSLCHAMLLLGEMLGYPLERHWRMEFHKYGVTIDQGLITLSLSSRLEDASHEHGYRVRRFAESYSTVVAFCLVFAIVIMLPTLRHSSRSVGPPYAALSFVGLLLAMLVTRWRLVRMTDQHRAHTIFSWCWFVMTALGNVVVVVAGQGFVMRGGKKSGL